MARWRERTYALLEGRAFGLGIMTLIVANVVALALSTVAGLLNRWGDWFHRFEVFSVVVFTVEYLLRLWSATCEERHRSPVRGRLRWAVTPLALIDLCAILPFYLPMILPLDLRFVRAARLLRVFRILKLSRYSSAMLLLVRVLRAKASELLATLALVVVLWVITGSLMYYCEHAAQPAAFSSIPAALWWSIVTLTTVGYGDAVPVTALGRILGGLTALMGIGFLALPTGILASGFVQELRHAGGAGGAPEPPGAPAPPPATPPAASSPAAPAVCPHCGKKLPPREP